VPVQNREDVRRLVERWETEASQRARKKDYAAELLQLGFPQPPRPPDPLPCIILMEGADAIGSPAEVARWFAAGVRMVGLAWRQSRYAGGTGHPGPLTAEGRKLAAALDAMGMIHDVSHLAEQSFWELLDITGGGVAASHSNCQAIVPGDRQLSDAMIRALGKRAGMIGINFYDRFLLPPSARSERATLEHVVAHVRHICDVLGDAGHVGLGTDMDGGFGREHLPRQIESWADVSRLADSLAAAGLSDQDIHGIMGGNWIEFFRANLP
jgi:membrane dipeptidase